ncbi:uncharacterized protein LOC121657567 isoform X1 [Corvus kubaryi]|uniref:uncharacterized protein LOC121657567 isoform X1 n=1 Tax=Corvus kubaryi TaxID=68294 RepID=UPI001C057BB3|nr:uncharacterized protein LOC121657567 isoform X1 [Corvus kubaryi]
MGIGKEGDPGQGCLSQIPGDPSLPPALFGVELGAGNAPWGLREGVGNSPWNSQGVGGAWHSRESSAGRWNSLVGNSSCRGRGPGPQGCFSGNLLLSLCNKNGFGSFGWRENPGFILCSSPVFLPGGMCWHSRRAWDGSGLCCHSQSGFHGSNPCVGIPSMAFLWIQPLLALPEWICVDPTPVLPFQGGFSWIHPSLAFPGWFLWIHYPPLAFLGWILWIHFFPLAFPEWFLWIHPPSGVPGVILWIHYPSLAFPEWILWIRFSPLAFLGWIFMDPLSLSGIPGVDFMDPFFPSGIPRVDFMDPSPLWHSQGRFYGSIIPLWHSWGGFSWIHPPLAFPEWFLWIHPPLAFLGCISWIHYPPLAFPGWIFMDPSPSGIPSSPIPTQLLGQALPHFSKVQSHFPCPGHPSGT